MHLSLMWKWVSKTAHVALRSKAVRVLRSQSGQTACRLEQILPHKKALLRAMPSKGIVCFRWQFLRLAPTARLCYPKGHASTTTVCCSGTLLPSTKVYKAWVGRISLQCESKSQKLLMSLEGIKSCESFGPIVDKLLAGLEQILPHNNHYHVNL